MEKVIAAGADFIVCSGWRAIRIVTREGHPVDWNAIYAPMQVGEFCELDVLVEPSGYQQKGRGKPLFQARLIIKRKDAGAAERSLRAARQGHQRHRRNQTMLPTTVAATGVVTVLTSIPATDMAADRRRVQASQERTWHPQAASQRSATGQNLADSASHSGADDRRGRQ
ncbi:hypothetical protein [Paracoccus denitrificans]|uniref:hypothetical protein n=1 Tax=Paracoccus denitrificans TaxID=266 RepID=UPI00131A1571|nr:hypothetical protein [Paracoccus denitrificans]